MLPIDRRLSGATWQWPRRKGVRASSTARARKLPASSLPRRRPTARRSERAMLDALVAGLTDPALIADVARVFASPARTRSRQRVTPPYVRRRAPVTGAGNSFGSIGISTTAGLPQVEGRPRDVADLISVLDVVAARAEQLGLYPLGCRSGGRNSGTGGEVPTTDVPSTRAFMPSTL